MQKIYVPNLHISNVLPLLIEIDAIIKRNANDDVDIDFAAMSTFHPCAMLIFGAKIKELIRIQDAKGKVVYVSNFNDKTYAGTMGFFRYMSRNFPFGKAPGEATGSLTYIPITRIKIEKLRRQDSMSDVSLEDYPVINRESQRLAHVLVPNNYKLEKLLTYLIRETLRNIPEHAQTNEMWICAQHWNWNNVTEISIADEGIGVYDSLRRQPLHREYIVDNKSALSWAVKAGISQAGVQPKYLQDDFANSGYGLYMISSICSQLDGEFLLISYGNYIKINANEICVGETSFHGTAVCIRISTASSCDYDRLILQTSMKAEQEAKLIKNANKQASYPSKGYTNI